MKGQKLFVRPMDAADADAVAEFLERESPRSRVPRAALLGKLVGNLVAVLAMDISPGTVTIRDLVVAHDLRRKRIGHFMIDEVAALAAKMDHTELVIACGGPREFLERAGFVKEGKRMVRRVTR